MDIKQLNEELSQICENKNNIEKMFSNCIDYLAELKERDSEDEWNYFWKEIIGMTDEDIEQYDLNRELW